MTRVPAHLLVEGPIDEVVLTRLIKRNPHLELGTCYGKQGRKLIEQRITQYQHAARSGLVFVCLADLDSDECPPTLLQRWLPQGKHINLLLRIAVREVEAWLLADRSNFAAFLGIPQNKIDLNPDQYPDPKQVVVSLARKSKHKHILRNVVPSQGSTAQVGKAYSDELISFAIQRWDIDAAVENSPSLARAVKAIESFKPRES
jgi:hypothetical protein